MPNISTSAESDALLMSVCSEISNLQANATLQVTLRWWYIGFEGNYSGVKSKETRSDQKGKYNSPIFSTQTTHALDMC